VVYLAVRDDGTFRKNVAVKVLKANLSDHDLVQRFQQERQVLANLDHPGIARILDGGQTADGLPYHVMEYVEGLPLDRFCDTQQLDLADRIRLFLQVIAAVHYLHDSLIVHRDLKHSNILVTGDGRVKLLDFGIAKMQTPSSQAPDLTGPDQRLLTPSYASPEQMAGMHVTRASDIYSLGLILYELITGRLPYHDAAAKLAQEPPLPSANIRDDLKRMPETTAQLRRRIVGDLDQIVLLCLRRDPRHRYTSASALGDDLGRFLDGKSVIARREPVMERGLRFLRRQRVAVAVAILILLTSSVGVWKTLQARSLSRQIEEREAAINRLLDGFEQRHDVKSSDAKTGHASGAAPVPATPFVPRVDDVRKLRRALEQDLAAAWSAQPGITPRRAALLERALKYLDSARGYATQNVAFASELAGAYKDIGVLYEPALGSHALLAYKSAAVVLMNASGGIPAQGANGEQWAFLVARIRKLGGGVPEYAIKPPPTGPNSRPQTESHARGQDTENQEEANNTPPEILLMPVVPIDPRQYKEVRTKLAQATYKAKLADETMQGLQKETAQMGQQVHPIIRENYDHMKQALDSAQKEFDSGDLERAMEDSKIAYACAARVLKEVGR